MTSYLDTRLGNLSRTGPFVQSIGQFNTLAELIAGHPANNYLPGTMAYTVDAGQMISDGSQWLNLGTTIPGEVELKVATYAKARLISGVTTGDILYVLGRTTQSDGGQGLFTWVAGGSTTINDGSQLSAPGGIWQRPDVTINAQWYGIDPTGVTASDVALNLAIQDAIIQKKKLVLPNGIFLLNAPLLCFKPGSNFTKIEIEGQGGAIPGTTNFPTGTSPIYGANTLLCVNSKLFPGMIFQSNRFSKISNLAIQGLNTTPFSSFPNPPTDTRADYIVSGCPTTFQSPYCAINIDPFPASAPTDGGYASLASYYGPVPSGTGSSGIVFENIYIQEFVVGVALSTAGVTQGDSMTFRNLNVNYCETGFVCGDSQARDCEFYGGNIANVRQVFDILNYGQVANGTNPINIESMNFGQCFRIFALGTSPCSVIACYAESIKTLGQCGKGGAGAGGGLTFEGCDFNIRDSWGSIPPLVLESSNPVAFKGCNLGSDVNAGRDAWNLFSVSNNITFEQCKLTGSPQLNLPPHIGIDWNAVHSVRTIDCQVSSTPGNFQLTDDYQRSGLGISGNAISGRLRATWQTQRMTDASTQYSYQPRATVPYISITVSALTIVSTTLTFTESVLGEVQVGDILMWLMLAQGYSALAWNVPAWKVATIDGGGNCVANALYDIAQYDTVANYGTQVGGTNKVIAVLHQWAPTTALTGNTHSNTTLDTLSANSLINGDWVQGVGIPAKTRVVSGGGTSSVVLSKAATSTLTGINLYDGQLVGSQMSGVYFPTQAGNTSTAPTPTFALGALQAWTLSNNATWSAPTGAWVAGNRLTLLVTSTGAFTTAWNAVYRNAPAWAVAANGQKATAEFMYDGTNWQFIGGSAAFA